MADRPRGHEVAVLGAGPIGCAIAYVLARKRLAPLVIDHGGPGGDIPGPPLACVWDHAESAETGCFGLESADQFSHLQDQVGPMGYLRSGGMVPARTDAEAEAGQALARTQASAGLPVRWLSREEALQREPALASDILGATYSPRDGVVNPSLMTRRLAAAARRAGATFLYHAGYVAVSDQARLFSLRMASEYVEVRRLVVASGVWLSLLDRQIGLGVSTRTVEGHVIVTEPLPPLVRHRLPGIRQQSGGEVVLDDAGVRGRDCAVATHAMHEAASAAIRIVPALRDARIVHSWPWRATVSPDSSPVLGKVEEGIFAAVPHTPELTLAPLLAHAVASIAVDGRVPDGLDAWNPRRVGIAPAAAGPLSRKDSPEGT